MARVIDPNMTATTTRMMTMIVEEIRNRMEEERIATMRMTMMIMRRGEIRNQMEEERIRMMMTMIMRRGDRRARVNRRVDAMIPMTDEREDESKAIKRMRKWRRGRANEMRSLGVRRETKRRRTTIGERAG